MLLYLLSPSFHLLTSICYLRPMNPMTIEDLESWQKARQIVRKIYELTRAEELCRDFGLCTQLQRAAVSLMSNIAEGFERSHLPEKLQFYNVARGSTAEVRSLFYVIEDNFPHMAPIAAALRSESVVIGKLVSGLIRSTEARKSRS
jgi:four helix bundle protein